MTNTNDLWLVRTRTSAWRTFIRLNESELDENKAFDKNADNSDWMLDVDKSCEGIHYILTGQSLADSEIEGYQDGALQELYLAINLLIQNRILALVVNRLNSHKKNLTF